MKNQINLKSVYRAAFLALCLMTVGVGNVCGASYYAKDGTTASQVRFWFNDNEGKSDCNLNLTAGVQDWSATPCTKLQLEGFNIWVCKQNTAGDNITYSDMYYRFYKSDETAPGYSKMSASKADNEPGAGDGYQNQTWHATGQSVNLLENAGKGGEYYFDYYFYTDKAGHLSNNSTQYRIKFNVQNRVLACNYGDNQWSLTARPLTDGKYILEDVTGGTKIKFKLPFYSTSDNWTRAFTGSDVSTNTSLGNTDISDDGTDDHNIQFTTPAGNASNVSIKFTGSAVKVDCYQERYSVSACLLCYVHAGQAGRRDG